VLIKNVKVMKKNLLIVLLFVFAFAGNTNAQISIPYEDTFESYDAGYDLTLDTNYSIKFATSAIVAESGGEDGDAYEGTKFGKLIPGEENNSTFKIKAGALDPGEYTFSIFGRPSENGKKMKITIYRGAGEKPKVLHDTTIWQKMELSFTVDDDTSTNDNHVTLVISTYTTQVIYFDNIVFEGETSSVYNPEEGRFVLAPNPSTGLFRINSKKAIRQYIVYNAAGQVIKEVNGLNQKTVEVDMNDFDKGLYMIRINDVDGNSKVLKQIIK
jgi:hypothetical protein